MKFKRKDYKAFFFFFKVVSIRLWINNNFFFKEKKKNLYEQIALPVGMNSKYQGEG